MEFERIISALQYLLMVIIFLAISYYAYTTFR